MDPTCDTRHRSGPSTKASPSSHKSKPHPSKNNPTKRLNKTETDSKPPTPCPLCLERHDNLEESAAHSKKCFHDMEDGHPTPTKPDQMRDDRHYCKLCDLDSRTLEDPTDHNWVRHPTCTNRGEAFVKTRQHEPHARGCNVELDGSNHKAKNAVECPLCDDGHVNAHQLKRHLENDHNIRKRKRQLLCKCKLGLGQN